MTNPRSATLAEELLARLPGSADVLPQKLDPVRGALLLIQFDAAAYRNASFLDDRILGPATKGVWVPLERVATAARAMAAQATVAARPLHFVFHTGHVGSTLVSRLLDETGAVLSLREPLPLRTLAEAHDVLGRAESLWSEPQFGQALGLLLGLWSRGYADTRCVVLKATSSAGRLAPAVLARLPAARAAYLNLRAEPYLATLLAGQNSPIDLRGHGPERVRRLQSRTSAPLAPLHALSPGELAALGWLVETWAQHDALARCPGQVLAIDFDAFLADVPGQLARLLPHFGLAAGPAEVEALARSPALCRYSKAPEHDYTPAVRAGVLAESRQRHAAEIRRGLAWLERLGRADPAVAAMLQAAG